MYNFSHFKENDKQVLLEFIKDHPFAFLTGSDLEGNQVATQIPFLLEERKGEWYVQGHIMRKTAHHKALLENPKSLVVFSGPHTYVSASWYTNPVSGSTWNYMSVHIAGEVRFMQDQELVELMKKLTLHFEKGNTDSLTIFDNLPDSYKDKMMPAIVGVEIKIDTLENVFKLSQNKDFESYQNILGKLNAQGGMAQEVAYEMEKRKGQLFGPKD